MENKVFVKQEIDPHIVPIYGCLICSNPTNFPNNHDHSNNNNTLLRRFSTITCRYLNINLERCKGLNLKPNETLKFTDKKSFIRDGDNFGDTTDVSDVCEDCRSVLKSFCDIYENWTYVQLQLNCRLREIKDLIQLHKSNQIQSNSNNNTQQHNKINGKPRPTSWEIFKKQIIKRVGHKRNPNDFPRLKLQREELKEPDLSDDLFSPFLVKKSKSKSKTKSRPSNSSQDFNNGNLTASKVDVPEIQISAAKPEPEQIKDSSPATVLKSPEISIIEEKTPNIKSPQEFLKEIPTPKTIFSLSNDNQKQLEIFLKFAESLRKPKDNHTIELKQSEPERDDRPFKCSLCPMSFKLELNRDRHLRGVHRFKKNPDSPEHKQTETENKNLNQMETQTESKTQVESKEENDQPPRPPPLATTISNEKSTEQWSIEYEDNEKENFHQHHHDDDHQHEEFPIMDTNEAVFATKNISSLGPGPALNLINPKSSKPLQPLTSTSAIKTRFQCSLCQNSYSARQSLIRHFRSAHLPKTSQKILKPKQTKNPKTKLHQKCYLCPMRFRTNAHLRAHRSCHHRRDTGNSSKNGGNFQFECSICQKHFSTQSACKRHGRFDHRGDSQFSVVTLGHGQPEKFSNSKSTSKSNPSKTRKILMKAKKCRFCPKWFSCVDARQQHENVHKLRSRSTSKVIDDTTPQNIEEGPPNLEIGFLGAVVKRKGPKKIRCITCSLIFGDLQEFKNHLRCRHKTDTCPDALIQDLHNFFVCDECGHIFGNIGALSSHQATHENRRKTAMASASPSNETTEETDANSVAMPTTSKGVKGVVEAAVEIMTKSCTGNLPNSDMEVVEEQNSENSQTPTQTVNNARRKQRLTTGKDSSEDLEIIKCNECPTYFFEEEEKNRHESSHQNFDNQNDIGVNDNEGKNEKIQKVMKDFAKAWNSFSS